MAIMRKMQAVWSGFVGAPGYTTWYWADGSTTGPAVMRAYFDAIKGILPSTVAVQVQSTGLRIDDSTGNAVGTWTEAAVAIVNGTAVGTYGAPAGSVVNWLTSSFTAGRRLRGRSFLVPISGNSYQSDGTIGTTSLGTLTTAAATAVTSGAANFLIWHRPVLGTGGLSAPVDSSTVPDKVVVLRSRRD